MMINTRYKLFVCWWSVWVDGRREEKSLEYSISELEGDEVDLPNWESGFEGWKKAQMVHDIHWAVGCSTADCLDYGKSYIVIAEKSSGFKEFDKTDPETWLTPDPEMEGGYYSRSGHVGSSQEVDLPHLDPKWADYEPIFRMAEHADTTYVDLIDTGELKRFSEFNRYADELEQALFNFRRHAQWKWGKEVEERMKEKSLFGIYNIPNIGGLLSTYPAWDIFLKHPDVRPYVPSSLDVQTVTTWE